MFSFCKKTFVAHEPGIDLSIHYRRMPLRQLPKWEAHRETRAPPSREKRVCGLFRARP
jgi:hypothetical protein